MPENCCYNQNLPLWCRSMKWKYPRNLLTFPHQNTPSSYQEYLWHCATIAYFFCPTHWLYRKCISSFITPSPSLPLCLIRQNLIITFSLIELHLSAFWRQNPQQQNKQSGCAKSAGLADWMLQAIGTKVAIKSNLNRINKVDRKR